MSAVLFSYTTGRELITPGLSGGHGKMHRHHCIFQTCFGAENHLRGRVISYFSGGHFAQLAACCVSHMP